MVDITTSYSGSVVIRHCAFISLKEIARWYHLAELEKIDRYIRRDITIEITHSVSYKALIPRI